MFDSTQKISQHHHMFTTNNNNEPILNASYDWQGQTVAVVKIEDTNFAFYKYIVTVEYIHNGRWTKLKTPWLNTGFKLTFAPAVSK